MVPDMMLENLLLPNPLVPDSSIPKYLPRFMRRFQFHQRPDYQPWYNCVLLIASVGMLVGALAVDHWWTERVSVISASTFEVVR